MACKQITLESTNCKIKSTEYGFYINEENIEDILKKQCENGLTKNKEYFASIKIEISAVEEEKLQIKKNWGAQKKPERKAFDISLEEFSFKSMR